MDNNLDSLFPIKNSDDLQYHLSHFNNLSEEMKNKSWEYLYIKSEEYNIIIPENNEIYRFINNDLSSINNDTILRNLSNVYVSDEDFGSTINIIKDNPVKHSSHIFHLENNINNAITAFIINTNLIVHNTTTYPINIKLYMYVKLNDEDENIPKIADLNVDIYGWDVYVARIIKIHSNFLEESCSDKKLSSSNYGVPSLKKYPMHDKKHVLLAIKFFNYAVGKSYEKELADNINKKIVEFKIPDEEIHIGPKNKFKEYYKPYREESYASVAPAVKVQDNLTTYPSMIQDDEDDLILNEGTLNQVSFGFRIHPHQNLDETLKKHTYQGYLNFVNKRNDIEDLKYLRSDVYLGLRTINTIKDRIDKINRLGDCKETHGYYNNITKKYISKGIKVKDCELTIKWFKEVVLKAISDRIKKLHLKNEDISIFNDDFYILNESLFFSKKDMYINFDKFEEGKSNICLITGLSGSGKSTLASSIASKYKALNIELDLFEQCYIFKDIEDIFKANEFPLYNYLKFHKELYEKLKNKNIRGKELGEEIKKYVKYCISYCKKDKDHKYVIEGVQIYTFLIKEDISSLPLVFKNTSMSTSIIRRIKRSKENGELNNLNDIKNLEIFKMLRWYFGEERALNVFKKSLKNEETIINKNDMPKYLYYLSNDIDLDGKILYPKSYNVNKHIEKKVRRIGFSDNIQGCLWSIVDPNVYNYYKQVYIPDDIDNLKFYKASSKDVYDAELTHEIWCKEPVKMKHIGTIYVYGVSTKYIDLNYINNIRTGERSIRTTRMYFSKWKWVDKKYPEQKSLYQHEISNYLKKYKILSEENDLSFDGYYVASKYYEIKEGTIDEDLTFPKIEDAINQFFSSYRSKITIGKPTKCYLWGYTEEKCKDEDHYIPTYIGELKVTFNDAENSRNFTYELANKNEALQIYEESFKEQNERKKILQDCKKYYPKFKSLGFNEVDKNTYKDSSKWFIKGNNNHCHILELPNNTDDKTLIKKINDLINKLNQEIVNYHFSFMYNNSIVIRIGNKNSKISKIPTKDNYNKAINIYKKIIKLDKYNEIKSAITILPYKIDEDNDSCDLLNYHGLDTFNLNKHSDEIQKYDNIIDTLISDMNKELKLLGLKAKDDFPHSGEGYIVLIKEVKNEDVSNILNEGNSEVTIYETIFKYIKASIILDMKTKEFIIKGIDYNKFFLRLREMYSHRGISNLFNKNYTWWSKILYKKEKITKNKMKITEIRCNLFFALEIYKMFLDLHDEYGLKYYAKVANNIYHKTWISNFESKETKDIDLKNLDKFRYTLKSYQLDYIKEYNTLKFKYDLEGYILSFEQGLGKTFTSIVLAECLNKNQIIIVCPNTLKENWANEIKDYYKEYYDNSERFYNEVYVSNNPKYKYTHFNKFLIVNQESIDKIYNYIDSSKNSMIIVDECHNFRNNNSDRTTKLLKLKEITNCKDNLPMSGTPIKATPDELIPVLRLIDPYFTKELAEIYKKAFNSNRTEISRVVRERFDRVIYRKTKKDVLNLPEKHILDLHFSINNEKDYYISNIKKKIAELFNKYYTEEIKKIPKLEKEFSELINKYSLASKSETKEYLNFISNRVRNKETNVHEYRLEIYNEFLEKNVYSNPKLTSVDRKRIEELVKSYVHIRNVALGKAIGEILPKARANCYIDIINQNKNDIINRIRNNPKKTVIFTAFLPVINAITEILNENNVGYVKIVGNTNKNARIDLINNFKYDDSIDVLIATTQTMSTGVTLTEANQMFFFGTPYRSSDFEQACDRIHRIGQTNEVFIYKVLLSSSEKNITERIDEILGWSLNMFNSIIDEEIQNVINEIVLKQANFNGLKRISINDNLIERYNQECPLLKKISFNKSTNGIMFLDENDNKLIACIIVNKQNIFKGTHFVLSLLWIESNYDKEHTNFYQKLCNISINTLLIEFVNNDNNMINFNALDYFKNSLDFKLTEDNKYLTNIKDLQENYNISLPVRLIYEDNTMKFSYNNLNKLKANIFDKLGTSTGTYNKAGIWCPEVYPYGENHPYRERVECIIFNDDNEVLSYINIKDCKIAGGGTMPDKTLISQLISECQEEVRANIKDIVFLGIYIHDFNSINKINHMNSLVNNDIYEGSYTYLFGARYNNRYTDRISAKDKDDLLSKSAFHPLDTFLSVCKNEWKVGCLLYLMHTSKNNEEYNKYFKVYQQMNVNTEFIRLNINNEQINHNIQLLNHDIDNRKIITEEVNIFNEANNKLPSTLSISKNKKKDIEELIYGFFNIVDKTGKNAEKYKNILSKLSDEEFSKWMVKFLNDDKQEFYLEILPNINEPSLKDIKKAADYLDLELDEYIYYRHDGDKDDPVRSSYKVPTGYQRIDRLQQTLAHKNTYSFDISQRNMKTGSLTGDNKVAKITDQEVFMLTSMGADKALEEFMSPRADNMEKKLDMLKQISMYGYTYLKDLPQDTKGQALKTAEIYFKSAMLKADI